MNTADYGDPEIAFAAELGGTLARMRAELDDDGMRRVLFFVLSRYGIQPREGDLYIKPMPVTKPRDPDPVVAPEAPAVRAPATIEPPARATCPICGWHTITQKGLNLHMYHKHGTTIKEHERQQNLNHEEPAP